MKRKFTVALMAMTMVLLMASQAQAGQSTGPLLNSTPLTSNPYSPAFLHAYRHGAVPTRETQQAMRRYDVLNQARGMAGMTTTPSGTLSYHGGSNGYGVTSGAPKVYLVVWGNQWGTAGTDANNNMTLSNDPSGAVPYLQQLFKGLGTGGELWSGVMTQYCDGPSVPIGAVSCPADGNYIGYPQGGAFAGIWYDDSAAAPASAKQSELAAEAQSAANHFGNTTAASNRYTQYVILSPTGTTPDNFNNGGGFCAWHSATGFSDPAGGPYVQVAYTNMPYVTDAGGSCGQNYVNGGSAGTLDGFSIVEGHEYAETVTDPVPDSGWINRNGSGGENGDECAWIGSGQGASANVSLSTGSFAMQSTWSNDTDECDLLHPIVTGINKLSVLDDVYGYGRSSMIFDAPGSLNIGGMTDAGSTSSVASGYYPVAIGDFNGDGIDDIVWTSPNNDLYLWLGGISDFTPKYIGTYPAGWVVEGAGDINGDGKADLLWLNQSTNQFAYWLMDGNKRIGAHIYSIAAGYYIATLGDFDGNGEVDVVWTSAQNDLYIWFGNGSGFTPRYITTFPSGWTIDGSADLVGQGEDALLWGSNTAQWGYWLMNGRTIAAIKIFDIPSSIAGYHIAANGDYNGDGKADIVWTNGTTAVTWVNQGQCSTGCNFTTAPSFTVPSGETIYNSTIPAELQGP